MGAKYQFDWEGSDVGDRSMGVRYMVVSDLHCC
jgi:hypothetical protein